MPHEKNHSDRLKDVNSKVQFLPNNPPPLPQSRKAPVTRDGNRTKGSSKSDSDVNFSAEMEIAVGMRTREKGRQDTFSLDVQLITDKKKTWRNN